MTVGDGFVLLCCPDHGPVHSARGGFLSLIKPTTTPLQGSELLGQQKERGKGLQRRGKEGHGAEEGRAEAERREGPCEKRGPPLQEGMG